MTVAEQQAVFAAVASPVCIAVGVFAFWTVQRVVRYGRFRAIAHRAVRRDDRPRVFWTLVWMLRVMGVIWIVGGIAIALSPWILRPWEQ
jgi:hypothetical protein